MLAVKADLQRHATATVGKEVAQELAVMVVLTLAQAVVMAVTPTYMAQVII